MSETEPSTQSAKQPSDARREASPSALRRLGLWCFGSLSGGLLRLLGATWRVETIGADPRQKSSDSVHLAALFHESMLPCAWFYRDRRYSVAVSRSRDGDLIGATLRALGYADPARGSSSRGGSAALLSLVRQLGAGTTAAVLVDGPRGPARVAKTGIVSLARMTGLPIQPVAFSARPAVRLRSWDQSLIPLPFARVVCVYGDVIELELEPDAPDETAGAEGSASAARHEAWEQHHARRLDEQLAELHHKADAILLQR